MARNKFHRPLWNNIPCGSSFVPSSRPNSVAFPVNSSHVPSAPSACFADLVSDGGASESDGNNETSTSTWPGDDESSIHHHYDWMPARQRCVVMPYAQCASAANLHSISQAMLAEDIPSYISARSANSIISEARPTRIQAETLAFLNRILDELLLFIVASSRSLATDRIKTDGLLKILSNNTLAKDAVLEAELELRNYLQGKKAEGGRVPLGLSATSRWDGTEAFPVNSAYNALRTRCQYYSTLGDREDDSATGDQHIMSPEGRPIATITPGVSIYVTALLEYVGEYILQHVSQIIERENSDEASLADLRSAIEEDEAMITLWRQMVVKQELEKRMAGLALAGGSKRVTRPWQVPDADELGEAAGTTRWRGSMTTVTSPRRPGTATSGAGVPPPSWGSLDRGGSVSGHGHTASEVQHQTDHAFSESHASFGGQNGNTATTPTSENGAALQRRGSVDKSLAGFFSGRRRGSFRSSQDTAQVSLIQAGSKSQSSSKDSKSPIVVEPIDDFEALMMSGETMKVSLTPNRLRTIEIARKEAEAKKEARQRPGTLSIAALKSDAAAGDSVRSISPSLITPDGSTSNRPNSRNSISGTTANSRKTGPRVSNPPSSYRGPDAGQSGTQQTPVTSNEPVAEPENVSPVSRNRVRKTASMSSESSRLLPRDKRASWSAAKDMIDLLNSTPPSPLAKGGQFSGPSAAGLRGEGESGTPSQESSLGRMGGKVRALWGRKSNSGKETPSQSFRSDSRQSNTTIASTAVGLEGPGSWRASETPEPDDSAFGETSQARATGLPDRYSSSDNNHFGPAGRIPLDAVAGSTGSHGAESDSNEPAATDTGGIQEQSRQGEGVAAEMPSAQSMEPLSSVETPTAQSASRFSNVNDSRGPLTTTAPVVGIYEEPASSLRISSGSSARAVVTPPLTSPQTLAQSRPEGPPSRRIPYGRRASRDDGVIPFGRRSSTHTPTSEAGEPANRLHRELSLDRQREASNSFGTPIAPATRSPNALARAVSSSISSDLPTQATNGSENSVIIKLLSGLDRQMRLCSTADECRSVITNALATSLRDATVDTSSAYTNPTQTPATSREDPSFPENKGLATPPVSKPTVSSQSTRPMPALVMADGYIGSDRDAAVHNENGAVAAWLLDSFSSSSVTAEYVDGTATAVASEDGVPLTDSMAEIASTTTSLAGHRDGLHIAQDGYGRERKLSQATVEDPNMYASADEGDIEDEDEDASVESSLRSHATSELPTKHPYHSTPTPVSVNTFAQPVGSAPSNFSARGKQHPPSASAAALRLSSTVNSR